MRWAITHIASSIGEPDHTERRHAGTLLQRAGRTCCQRFCRTWAHFACTGSWNGIAGRSHVRHQGTAACSAASRPWRLGEQQGSLAGTASQRRRGAARPLDVREATGGRGIGWLGLHFGRVRGSAADCRSNIWRVRIEMKIPAEAGIRCGCRNGGLTRARALRKRRWRRRSRPSGRAPARQPVPTRHEGGS